MHLITIVAADIEGGRAPAGVAVIDGDATIIISVSSMLAIVPEQQAVHFEDAIDALGLSGASPVF